MRINATHTAAKFLTCVALAITSFSCEAAKQHANLDICQLLGNVNGFDGKTVELSSDVKFTIHGRYLFGASCHELGSIGLSIDEKKYDDERVIKFVKKVMWGKGRVHVILVGRFTHVPSENLVGLFALSDIVELDDGAEMPRQ